MPSSMERTFDIYRKTVHLVDKRKKHPVLPNTFMCACGKEPGWTWTREPQDSRPTCLICQAIDNKVKG